MTTGDGQAINDGTIYNAMDSHCRSRSPLGIIRPKEVYDGSI